MKKEFKNMEESLGGSAMYLGVPGKKNKRIGKYILRETIADNFSN